MTFTSPPSVCLDLMLYTLHDNLYSVFPHHCQQTHGRPLTVLFLSQGYEDWLRHKADCSINECPVDVVQQGKVVRTQSHKLRVRMASLERYSTWGHRATLQYCCIAHFFYNCLSPPSHPPFPFLSAVLPNFVSFLSRSLLSLPTINCPWNCRKGAITVSPGAQCRSPLGKWAWLMYFISYGYSCHRPFMFSYVILMQQQITVR